MSVHDVEPKETGAEVQPVETWLRDLMDCYNLQSWEDLQDCPEVADSVRLLDESECAEALMRYYNH